MQMDDHSHITHNAFALTSEQESIRDMARDFADANLAPHALKWDAEKHFPLETIRAVAPLGIGGIYVREDVGGSGLKRLDAALVFEALSTGCPAIASYISIHNMCSWMIDKFGSPELRQTWLPRLTAMELLASYCLTEPNSGSD